MDTKLCKLGENVPKIRILGFYGVNGFYGEWLKLCRNSIGWRKEGQI